jgi:hypothetical protein
MRMTGQRSQPADRQDDGGIERRQASEIREVSATIRPRVGAKSDAGGAPNVGAAGCGASVCAETSQGMKVTPVPSVIVIKKAYAGCLTGRDHRQVSIP